MINRKTTIAAVVAVVMLIGSNESVMACTGTEGKCIDVTSYTAMVNVPEDATAAKAAAEAAKAQAEADAAKAAAEAAKAQADAAAARAAAEAAEAQNNIGTGSITNPVVPTPLSMKVINPVNGDIIETSFDAVTKTTISNMICARKDAPDTLTITSPSGTDATIAGDGDTFTCNVGYYGNAISPVNLSADYKSSLKIQLLNSSVMSGEINNNNMIQYVSLTIDNTSKWNVEGTSYLTALVDADTTLANIVDNGNTIYYNSSDNANGWLEGKTYSLNGGGKLMPM